MLSTYVALGHMILLCQWIYSSLTSILKHIKCDSVLCNGTLLSHGRRVNCYCGVVLQFVLGITCELFGYIYIYTVCQYKF